MIQDRYSLAFKLYPYARSADQDAGSIARHPVVVMGGGPIGMAVALDLGLQGIPVVVLDDHEGVGTGSRAICFSKRSLEIADRYGCSKAMVEKGVVWNLGKVFHREGKVFEFNLAPETGHKFPAFINLPQPYFEQFLVDRIRQAQAEGAPIEIRGKNRVQKVDVHDDHVGLHILTPEGPYMIESDWLIGCDGASSPLRKMMGLEFSGKVFKDSFLIADIQMTADFPTERWFWFDPVHTGGASTLLHKQPDNVWRIDFQIGWDVDRQEELKEANIRRRLDAMLGPEVDYELVWSSIYTFQCMRMDQFRHGKVLFAGDSAHQVSPFGARGANSGVQDADNLGWKLGLVINGVAPESLLDSYDRERVQAADENILNSTRSTDFISPKTDVSRLFRDAVLDLARDHEFARPMVNSGRLSVPCIYDGSPLNSRDELPDAPDRARPGASCPDVQLTDGFLLEALGGEFHLIGIGTEIPKNLRFAGIDLVCLAWSQENTPQILKERLLGNAGSGVYLVRPDQHIAGRWPHFDAAKVKVAVDRAIGRF